MKLLPAFTGARGVDNYWRDNIGSPVSSFVLYIASDIILA